MTTTAYGPVTQLDFMEGRLKDAQDVADQHWPADRRMCHCVRNLPCPVEKQARAAAAYWRARIAYYRHKQRQRPRHLRAVPDPVGGVTRPLPTVSRSGDTAPERTGWRTWLGWRLRNRNG